MTELLIVALVVLGFALVSRRLATSPVTAPMVFTTVGLVVGLGGLGWFDLTLENEAVTVLVEATLVLVLFTDAIRIDLRALRRQASLPGRLLGIGMPLTVVAGAGVAVWVVPGLGLVEGALLAAVLAPTDAALGQAVVSDERLPTRVRQTINVESGLNDGIAVPLVTVLLAAVAAEGVGGAGDWVGLAAQQVGFGVLAGLLAGVVGGRLLDSRAAAGAVEGIYRQLATLAVAAAAYALAGLLDGNGFIAAFTAGLAFGQVARSQCTDVQDFTEDEGELLSALTFLIFGAVLVGPVLDELTWPIAAYVVASLTVVRDAAGAGRPHGLRHPARDQAVPGLVRPPRPGLDPLRAPGGHRARLPGGHDDLHRGGVDGAGQRLRPRADRPRLGRPARPPARCGGRTDARDGPVPRAPHPSPSCHAPVVPPPTTARPARSRTRHPRGGMTGPRSLAAVLRPAR